MKHNVKITLILIGLFFIAQIIGLVIVNHYIPRELPYNIEKPEFKEQTSFIPISIFIIIATVLALFLIRFRARLLWKLWFLFAIIFGLSIAFSVFIPSNIAFIVGVLLGLWKMFKPNVYIHNFTELFIYGGISALFVPILNVFSATILLVLISLYDMYAVWKSRHMIKLAKFQSKLGLFAGLFIPYGKRTAILGGGDITFPLLFAGAVLKSGSFVSSFIVVVFATIALSALLYFAEKGKFYPAMPFISAGCFIGYLVSLI